MQGLESLDKFKGFVSQLGGLGRFEDTYIVHAAEGETVVPMEVLDSNPILKERLFETMRDMGIQPERYVVGNEFNSINPITGQPEFFLKWLGKRLKKGVRDIGSRLRKGAADISGYAAPIIGAMYGPAAGAAVGALLGQYKRENPGDPSQWQKMALRGGLSGLAANVATGQGLLETGLSDVYNTWNPMEIGSKLLTPEGWGEALKKGGDWRMFQEGSGVDRIINKVVDAGGNLEKTGNEQKSIVQKIFGWDKVVEWGLKGLLSWKLGDIIKKENEEAEIAAAKSAAEYGKRTNWDVYDSLIDPGKLVQAPNTSETDYWATAADGGILDLDKGGELNGPGTGTSDSIPAMLSDGEFVMTARAVRGAGGGDRREGARKMYEAMDKLEAQA
jgi:hypothetical protein